jgi:hypothetical protein
MSFLGIGTTSADSWSVVQVQGFISQNLTLVDPSTSPQPTISTLQWRTYSPGGDWVCSYKGTNLLTVHNLQVLFQYDPTFPALNPSVAIISCSFTTMNSNGHFWQTDQWPQPVFVLTIMGKSGYAILPETYLGDLQCMPWDMTFSKAIAFDPTQWDSINYCTIGIGRDPTGLFRMHTSG